MIALLVFFVAAGLAIVGVLVDLQTIRPDRYRSLGEDQRTRTRNLAGFRGSLIDRNGFVLAVSTPGKELVVDPTMVTDPAGAAALLAPVLGLNDDELALRLIPDNENDRFELLVRTADEALIGSLGAIMSADEGSDGGVLRGVFLRAEEARVYPAGTLARPVVGLVDDWEQGQFGLEEQFNDLMQGSPGSEVSERGIFGSIAGGYWEIDPAEKGYDVVLTLDHRIQFITEQALIAHCQELGAESANAVVSSPRTGEILAMANVVRLEDGTCAVPKYNAPLVETFEPGSVMKMITAAAAVEELGFTAETVFEVPNSVRIGDVEFKQPAGFTAGSYPFGEVIARSLNVGTIKLADRLGPEVLYDYYRRFGFGQFTGLEFEGESRGLVRPASEWRGSDLGSIAIGQGVSVNTVQIMAAYNTLANDGVYVAPRLVKSAIGPDGLEYAVEPQEARRVVSAATANEVTGMLVGGVDRGTGQAAAVDGYLVAGKTGTAWKVFDDGSGVLGYGSPGNRRFVLSFVGFLPADDPQLSIVVTVNEPEVAGSAGKIAAPLFADIAPYALRILAIPPTGAVASNQELVWAPPAPAPGIPPLVDPNAPVVAAPAPAPAPVVAPVEEVPAEEPPDQAATG